MAKEKSKHADALFDGIATLIDNVGKGDAEYSDQEKSLDILEVLEALLGYAIFATSVSEETVRDSADESHVNVKRHALALMQKEQNGEFDNVE